MAILIIILSTTDRLGKNIFGTCSFKGISKAPMMAPIPVIIYLIVKFFYFINIKKNLYKLLIHLVSIDFYWLF